MINELVLADTFGSWMTKINALVADHNATVDNLNAFIAKSGIVGAFGVNSQLTTGLTLAVNGGNVRNGSLVETIAASTVTLPASSTRILAIYKIDGTAPSLQLYATTALPEKNIIPIGIFTTNATAITAYTDLRTQFSMSSGSAGSASGVLQFDAVIDTSLVVPSNKNALSVAPTVKDGVTVTVSDGSTWVIL